MNDNQGLRCESTSFTRYEPGEAFEGAFGAVGQMHGDGGCVLTCRYDASCSQSLSKLPRVKCKDLFDSSPMGFEKRMTHDKYRNSK